MVLGRIIAALEAQNVRGPPSGSHFWSPLSLLFTLFSRGLSYHLEPFLP